MVTRNVGQSDAWVGEPAIVAIRDQAAMGELEAVGQVD